jgi:hypothetical protein
MFSIIRRRRLIFSYTIGPWLKLLLMSCCLAIFNVGLLVKSLPDQVMGPLLVIFLAGYALSVIFVASNRVGPPAVNE